jgi:hypothetical protein
MGFSTANAEKVMFSKGARVLVGAVDAAKAACTPVGLLGADATLNINPTYRQKQDRFPEVIVAEAIQSVTAEGRFVLREWTKENLRLALGLATDDVTDVAGVEVNVVDEAHTVDAAGKVVINRVDLSNIVVKEGAATLVLNTDYVVVETTTQTLIVALSGGAIAPLDTLLISYDYTPVAHSILPIGKASAPTYYGVWIEEELTGSATARSDFQIYKARIGLDGGFNINNAEQGADIPIVIQAVLASGKTELGQLFTYA